MRGNTQETSVLEMAYQLLHANHRLTEELRTTYNQLVAHAGEHTEVKSRVYSTMKEAIDAYMSFVTSKHIDKLVRQ